MDKIENFQAKGLQDMFNEFIQDKMNDRSCLEGCSGYGARIRI